jgi:antitoxin VapB
MARQALSPGNEDRPFQPRDPPNGAILVDVENMTYISPQVRLHQESAVPINVNNPEADALTRRFAAMTGLGITEAIVTAMREAIERRRAAETAVQTAARLREKHGLRVSDQIRTPLAREAFDEMWGEG